MFRRHASLLLSGLIFSLALTGCFGGKDKPVEHLETLIPGDVGLFLSYSLENDEQFQAVQDLEKTLGDEGRVSRTLSETLDESLNYEEDLLPALGEQFHMVYGVRAKDDGEQAFSVVTLEDVEKMQEVLDEMVKDGALTSKKLSKLDAYVNEEESFYAAIDRGTLWVTNTADALVEMRDLAEKNSLWASDVYQDSLKDIGKDYLFYGVLFPDAVEGTGIAALPGMINQQTLVVRAEKEGFRFDVYVQADKEKMKEADLAFDDIPRSEPYLFEEVPTTGLMGYMESYGLQQSFEKAEKLGDESGSIEKLDTFFLNFFAMDFGDEILSFMDKGYALSLHQNGEGVIPGMSLLVDASSDKESAEEFVAQMDLQIEGLLVLLEAALPGAVSKDTVMIEGKEFTALTLDLSKIERTPGATQELPEGLMASEIQLAYGMLEDRLLLTTAKIWQEESGSIADSDLYKDLNGQLKGVKDGLVLFDAQGISSFVASLSSLRSDLDLETTASTDQLDDFLDGFLGLIAASDTQETGSHFGGFLMISK